MSREDYYKVLGISRDAAQDDVKKAFRKLAMKHHPDRNKGTAGAEERFKKINEAYAVISDPEKRKQYDMFGADGFHSRYSQDDIFRNVNVSDLFNDFGFDVGGGDFFSNMFGRRGRGRRDPGGGRPGFGPQRGDDLVADLTITFREAVSGGQRRVPVRISGVSTEIDVRIPHGISEGQKLRIPGRGMPGVRGGKPGDLLLKIVIMGDDVFRREDNDIYLDMTIPLRDALLGTVLEVPTLDSPKRIKIRGGTQPGTKIRLGGYGVPAHKGLPTGDLYVVITVKIPAPSSLNDDQRQLIESLP